MDDHLNPRTLLFDHVYPLFLHFPLLCNVRLTFTFRKATTLIIVVNLIVPYVSIVCKIGVSANYGNVLKLWAAEQYHLSSKSLRNVMMTYEYTNMCVLLIKFDALSGVYYSWQNVFSVDSVLMLILPQIWLFLVECVVLSEAW